MYLYIYISLGHLLPENAGNQGLPLTLQLNSVAIWFLRLMLCCTNLGVTSFGAQHSTPIAHEQ